MAVEVLHRKEINGMKSRLIHLDMLRGLAMLMVIYSHVCVLLLVKDGVSVDNSTLISDLLSSAMLPIFFFLGGFLLYKKDYTVSRFRHQFKSRFIAQLWPTVVLMVIFCFMFRNGDVIGAIHAGAKYGYWYPYVYAVIFLIVASILLLWQKTGGGKKQWLVGILLIFAFLCYAAVILHYWSRTRMFGPEDIWQTYSLEFLLYFTQFYITGFICGMYKEKFEKAISKAGWLMCVLFLVCFFAKVPQITRYLGVAAFYFLCKKSSESKSPAIGRFNHWISHIGQITLEIYLLHYFFLYGLKEIDAVHRLYDLKDTLYEFPAFLAVVLLITGACIALLKILQITKIKTILFPTFANKKTTL